jgi:hypothetical protein
VPTQPAGLTCLVNNGGAAVDVNNVSLSCSVNAASLGGVVKNLIGSGLQLSSNGQTAAVAVTASSGTPRPDVSFAFTSPLAGGSSYSVTVKTQPAGQTCSVSNGSGRMTGVPVTGVVVTCNSVPLFTLGGTVSGNSNGLVLSAGADSKSFAGAVANFTFGTALAAGTSYNVTVQTQPAGQTCTVRSGSGVMSAANVSNVLVTCVADVTPTGRYSTVGSYPITDCVKDNSTGLTWEGKPTSGLRASSNYYTNFDSTTALQYSTGSTDVAPTQSQIDAATNSIGYKNAVNASALCGYNNWRLPTLAELQGLVLTGVGSRTIDTTWFPNTQSWYWTSTPYDNFAGDAWVVNFLSGGAYYSNRNFNYYLRLVR